VSGERAPQILLGVTGGIAAYKAPELVRLLARAGAEVRVILTGRAEAFVAPQALAVVSGHPVHRTEFPREAGPEIPHVELAEWADAFLVAPATGNVLAKIARGIADDLLSSAWLAFRGPSVVAPAMNPRMWDHPATRENVALLEARGVEIVPPGEGFVACGDTGPGRLAELDLVAERALLAARRSRSLAGRTVLVTAGPTREPIDPVRFVGNRSSGKMGFAVAAAARARGARVVLVHGPVCLPRPFGVEAVSVETAREMEREVLARLGESDVLVMAAAVADHRPASAADAKLSRKGEAFSLELVPNPDILSEAVAARRPGQVIVGFAAETGDAARKGAAKRRRKGADLLVANDVTEPGSGFGTDTNRVWLVGPGDDVEEWPRMSKRQVAERLLDRVEKLLSAGAREKGE